MRVVLNNGQYRITIPKEMAEFNGLGPGSKVMFVMENGKIVLEVMEKKPLKRLERKKR